MDEYIPSYLKDHTRCPRCNNNLSKERVLSFSYLNECKKCSNMGMYSDNQNYYMRNNDYNRNLLYESCSCKTEYIYKNIIKCDNCIRCDECKEKLSYKTLYDINSIKSNHLCNKCFKKINYNITENVNY